MKLKSLWWSLVVIGVSASVASASASGRASLGLDLNAVDAPPAPMIVMRDEPRVVVVPNSTVYVVEDHRVDHDLFRYGVFWYVHNDGYWYRGRSSRGPFTAVDVKYVPRAVITVPAKHWRHHPNDGPPDLMRRHAMLVREKGPDHGRH